MSLGLKSPKYLWFSFKNISGAVAMPNGSLSNLKKPKGVLNVHKSADGGSNFTCQNLFFMSNTLNNFL